MPSTRVDAKSSVASALALLVGAVVVSTLSAIPVVGDLTNFVLGTVGMGAVASRFWENRKE